MGRARTALALSASFALSAAPPPLSAQQDPLQALRRMVPPEGQEATAVASGDVNGDGFSDVFVGNWGPNALLLNDGQAQFGDASANIPEDATRTWDAVIFDANGDGDADIATAEEHAPNHLYANDGTGVFAELLGALPFEEYDTRDLEVGDFDLDGDLDLFLAYRETVSGFQTEGGENRLYLNNGAGFFSDNTNLVPESGRYSECVESGDLDGDGDLDIVVGNSTSNNESFNRLLFNTGAGFQLVADPFWYGFPFQTSGKTHDVELGDVDGDGDLDAFFASQEHYSGSGVDELFLNDGLGGFSKGNFPLDSVLPRSAHLEDFNGDGHLDLFIGTGHFHNSVVDHFLVGDGAGNFVEVPAQLPQRKTSTRDSVAVDFDGDGDLDLFRADAHQDVLLLNDASTRFVEVGTELPSDEPFSVTVRGMGFGDVDSDGDLDVVTAGLGVANGLWLNDGTGVYDVQPVSPFDDGESSYSVLVEDFDGDGDVDVFFGNNGQNSLWLGDGAGGFVDATVNLPVDDISKSLLSAAGDLDNDGDLDILLPGMWIQGWVGPARLLNDGNAVFTLAPPHQPGLYVGGEGMHLGDVNGDGNLDVYTSLYSPQGHSLLLGDGAGNFADVTATAFPALSITHGVGNGLVDVDGDGDLDALLGSLHQPSLLFLNDGSGVFTELPNAFPPAPRSITSFAGGDVDGDGHVDLLLGNSSQLWYIEKNGLVLGDGSGLFSDATNEAVRADYITYVAYLEDVDGDGDPDALFAGNNRSQVLHSTAHQLAWKRQPRLNANLELDLYGTPGTGWFLWTSLGSASIPLPGLGTLGLDPFGAIFAGNGNLDGSGRDTATFFVPNNPAFADVNLHWQALFTGNAPQFSNLERTQLLAL